MLWLSAAQDMRVFRWTVAAVVLVFVFNAYRLAYNAPVVNKAPHITVTPRNTIQPVTTIPNVKSNPGDMKAYSSGKLWKLNNTYQIHFRHNEQTIMCRSASITEFYNAWIGTCGTIMTEDIAFMSVDFFCKRPCHQFCGKMYEKYFQTFSRIQETVQPKDLYPHQNLSERFGENLAEYFSESQVSTIRRERILVPVLFYWGHAFPHVVKDVMPRVVFALPYLETHPQAKLLMDDSPSVRRFLKRLKIPLSRVIFTPYHTPDSRSLYHESFRGLYAADVIALPHCHPGPLLSGLYSHEMYASLHKALIPNTKEIVRNKLIYVSRDGGFNSDSRRIDNEEILFEEILDLVEEIRKFGGGFQLVKFTGVEVSLDSALDLFSSAVLVFGPHGGGFYNMIGCQARTFVVELSPDDYGRNEVARFAHSMNLNYHGFMKQHMKRTEAFGDVDIGWIRGVIGSLLLPEIYAQPDLPKGWKRHDPSWLFPKHPRRL